MKISISKKEWQEKYATIEIEGNVFMNHTNFRVTESNGTPTFTYITFYSFGDGAMGNSRPVVKTAIDVNVFDWKDYSTVAFRSELAKDLEERKKMLK